MFFDVAVRDLEIALAALVLARMTEVRQRRSAQRRRPRTECTRAIAAGCARPRNRAETMHQGRSWTLFRALSVSIHDGDGHHGTKEHHQIGRSSLENDL
jgi:hypothetical protein